MKRFLYAFASMLALLPLNSMAASGVDGTTGSTQLSSKAKPTQTTKPTATKDYKIQLHVTGLKNDTAYLAYYMNGKTYSKDTTVLDARGKGLFSKKEKLDEGVYIVYFNPEKYFDLLVGQDQHINISVDTADISNAQITGSAESADFQNYFHFLAGMNKKRSDMALKYRSRDIDSATFVNAVDKMTEEVEQHQKEIVGKHQNDFLGAYIKGTIPVETPEMNELPDSIRPRARYQYFKHHFFDNINLSDPRFLRTPYFPSMVDKYIGKHILQDPDTLAETAFELIEKSRGDSLTFQVMTSKMINYGISSKMMGMDAMWYKIADRYYFSGLATWADTAWVNTLRKEAKKIRHNLVGMQARELAMRDSMNNAVKLSEQTAELVLVYFFEPSCGHCRHTTPILHDSVYAKWKSKGFEVFACYTQTDRKEWMDFVHKHHLEDWVNVWDPFRESWFWDSYDTSSTPGLYLLNKDRKIIAKKIDTDTLDMIIEEELVKRKQKNPASDDTTKSTSNDSGKKNKSKRK